MNKFLNMFFFILCAFWIFSCTQSTTEKIDRFLTHCYENNQFNGALLVSQKGKLIYHNVFGISNIDPIESLQLDSQFRLASLSKPFTAMAIMILKEQGKLQYEDDISKYLPELPYNGITIHHLLTHTSGIIEYEKLFKPYWDPDHQNFEEKNYADNDDVIDMLVKYHPAMEFDPGEKWVYNNTGYVLLASIVSRVADEPFEVFLKDNIFNPLGMTHTLVYSAIRDESMENRVYGYRLALNGVDYSSNDFHYMSGIAGDGAIYSTVGDLYKWDRALYTNKLVSEQTLEEAFTPVKLNDGSTHNYGFGWGINTSLTGKKAVSHGGGWIAARTWLWREIEEDNTIIILTNHTSRYIYDIRQGINQILHDEPYSLPKIGIADVIGKYMATEGIEKAVLKYTQLKEQMSELYKFDKWELNNLGYELIRLERVTDAIEIFKLNVDSYPKYASAYSGLGEAYTLHGNVKLAIINFEKSLEFYPDNDNVIVKLKQLQEK